MSLTATCSTICRATGTGHFTTCPSYFPQPETPAWPACAQSVHLNARPLSRGSGFPVASHRRRPGCPPPPSPSLPGGLFFEDDLVPSQGADRVSSRPTRQSIVCRMCAVVQALPASGHAALGGRRVPVNGPDQPRCRDGRFLRPHPGPRRPFRHPLMEPLRRG